MNDLTIMFTIMICATTFAYWFGIKVGEKVKKVCDICGDEE